MKEPVTLTGSTLREKVDEAVDYVASHVSYAFDEQTHGVSEKILEHDKVLEIGKADCEDQSFLCVRIMRDNDIDAVAVKGVYVNDKGEEIVHMWSQVNVDGKPVYVVDTVQPKGRQILDVDVYNTDEYNPFQVIAPWHSKFCIMGKWIPIPRIRRHAVVR